jgi:YfiH family protein
MTEQELIPPVFRLPVLGFGFGTLEAPVPEALQSTWERLRPQWSQVHGCDTALVTRASQECGNVDALLTFEPGLPIAVRTADCVPILLAREDGAGIAAIHAGWRGTEAEILTALGNLLQKRGEQLSRWQALIGPSIGPCCYEVSEELAEGFKKKFGADASPEYRKLDLPLTNAKILARQGFGDTKILRVCTHCAHDGKGWIYSSFRREGTTVRQYSGIVLRR